MQIHPSRALARQRACARSVTAAVVLLAVLMGLALPAGAQSRAADVRTYHIPAGPLATSLNRLAGDSGITLSFDPALVAGKRAGALDGRYTVAAGLRALLAGSGVEAVAEGSGYRLRAATAPDASMLAPIDVAAAGERANGPVGDYVPRRSATATKTDVPLIEVPQSVTAVSREQLRDRGVDTLSDAFDYSPGVYALGGDASKLVGTQLVSRGFNITGSQPLYLNGSKFPIRAFSGGEEPYFYERIELLKGPSSILYGQAAPGGIINLVSKRPTPDPYREIGVEVGSWHRKTLKGDFAGPLTDDGRWGYRVVGLYRDGDSMIDEIPDDRQELATTLSWQPNDRTSLTLLGTLQRNDTMYDYGKPYDGTVFDNPNGKLDRDLFVGEPDFDRFEIEKYTLGYLFEHRLSDIWTFRQNLLGYDTHTDYRYVGISSQAHPDDRSVYDRSVTARIDEEQGVSVDNQLQADFGHGRFEHTALVGLSYTDQEFTREQSRGVVGPLDGYDPIYGTPVTSSPLFHNKTDSTQLGLYAQDHIKYDDRWVVLLGGRWDDFDSDSHAVQANGATSDSGNDDDALTYRAGLIRLFDNGLAPYVSYTESFQSSTGTDVAGNAFDPTTGQQYEIGVKYEPLWANATITLAAYELTQQNVTTADPDNPGFSEQTGEVRSRGVELEARASLSERFDMTAAYSYTDAEITRSNNGNEGNTPTSVPEQQASLWGNYHFTGVDADGLSLGGGVRYVGESVDNNDTFEVPSFTVFDAAASYRLDAWLFRLNVRNLFDKTYVSGCTFSCFYGEERNVTLSAMYRW